MYRTHLAVADAGWAIHGSSVDREQGMRCFATVPLAARRICTGARITVDRYLGIVILG